MDLRSIAGVLCAAALLTAPVLNQNLQQVQEAPLPDYTATGRENPAVLKNEYPAEAFSVVDGFTVYTGGEAASHIGIDVSNHQGEIDWTQVKEAGVEYAMIRAGYRGYTTGQLHQDQQFQANMQGALDAGLDVGVYFFSQAVSEPEAREEARTLLRWIRDYDVTYPVVYDWEEITDDAARTDDVPPEMVTRCVKAFCDTVAQAGYTPMVYFNQNQGYEIMDLTQFGDYELWLAAYMETPTFAYSFDMWQYSDQGAVPGIEGRVDLDLCLVDYGKTE